MGVAEESEEVTSFDSEEQKEDTLDVDLDKTVKHQTKGNLDVTKTATPTQTILHDLNRVLGSTRQTYDTQKHMVRSIKSGQHDILQRVARLEGAV